MTDLKGLGAASSHRMATLTNKDKVAGKGKRLLPKLSDALSPYDSSLKPTKYHVSV